MVTDRPTRVIVVGGGLGAARTIAQLRRRGFEGHVVLLGAEARLPYDRPPLSKAVLAGHKDDTTAPLRSGGAAGRPPTRHPGHRAGPRTARGPHGHRRRPVRSARRGHRCPAGPAPRTGPPAHAAHSRRRPRAARAPGAGRPRRPDRGQLDRRRGGHRRPGVRLFGHLPGGRSGAARPGARRRRSARPSCRGGATWTCAPGRRWPRSSRTGWSWPTAPRCPPTSS